MALGVPRERITVIENGVDVDALRRSRRVGRGARTSRARPAGEPLVGSVGCLAPRKDYGTLLAALALLRDRGTAFRCAIVGDGPERAALEAHSRELGLAERVAFLGERDRRGPPAAGVRRVHAVLARGGHPERAARGHGGRAAVRGDARGRQRRGAGRRPHRAGWCRRSDPPALAAALAERSRGRDEAARAAVRRAGR